MTLTRRPASSSHCSFLNFPLAELAWTARAFRRLARFFSSVLTRAAASDLARSCSMARCAASAASIFWMRANILALYAIASLGPLGPRSSCSAHLARLQNTWRERRTGLSARGRAYTALLQARRARSTRCIFRQSHSSPRLSPPDPRATGHPRSCPAQAGHRSVGHRWHPVGEGPRLSLDAKCVDPRGPSGAVCLRQIGSARRTAAH